MNKKFKLLISLFTAVLLSMSCCATAFAAEGLKVNSSASVNVGDTITYTLYLSECTQPIEGIQMYIYYDKNYLKVDSNSMKYDKFDGVIQNPDCDGYITFNWTNVTDLANFSTKAKMVSVDFKVVKGGKTDISQFIQELYGNDMKYIKSYVMTYSISVNDKTLISNKPPVINDNQDQINGRQGDFINYVDGMGEENTPNKNNHTAVKGNKQNGTQIVTNYVDVTKQVTSTVAGSSNIITTVVIAAIIIVIIAIAVVIFFKKRDKSNIVDTNDSENNE